MQQSAIQAGLYLIWWMALFRRTDEQMETGMTKQNRPDESPMPPHAKRGERHPLFGALKDITFVPSWVDLTEPADPDWGEISERNAVPPARR
jgi:hypothetical protein